MVCSYTLILVSPGVEIGFPSQLMLERARCVEASVMVVVFFDGTSRLYLVWLLYAPLVDCVDSRPLANSCFGSYLVGLT